MAQKYQKNYQNLSTIELTCIFKSIFPESPTSRFNTKPLLIEKIKQSKPDFDKQANQNIFYYFTVDNQGVVNLVQPTPETENEYSFQPNSTKNAFAQVTPPTTPQNSEISELQAVVENLSNTIASTRNNSNRSKFGNLKFKIQFDESKGIHQFLNSVERYAEVNNIFDGQDRVLIAINGLADSDYSDMITETLTLTEKSNWEFFKAKLVQLLGKTVTYYKAQFRHFKRIPSETLGVMFTRLTFTYKKAYKENCELTESDKRLLISTFIEKLNPRLSQLLMTEEATLTFNTVAGRAEELETIYSLNSPVMDILNVIEKGPQKSVRNSDISELMQEFRRQNEAHEKSMARLIDSFATALKNNNQNFNQNSNFSNNRPPRSSNRKSNVEFHKLENFCFYMAKNGKCTNGNNCRYKHSDIPQHIVKICKEN